MSRTRATQSKLRMNARLIREKDRARASELRRLLLSGAIIAALLLGYVWQRVEFVRTSRHVEGLQQEKTNLEELNKQMTIERALLSSPKRIEKVAREQLGMIDPPPENVRRVRMIDGRLDPGGGPVVWKLRESRRGGDFLPAAAGILPALPRKSR